MKTLLALGCGIALLGAAQTGASAPVTISNGEYEIEYLGQSANGDLVDFSWRIRKLDADASGLNHATFALDFTDCGPGVALDQIVVAGTVTQAGVTDQNVLLFWIDPDTGLDGVSFTGLSWLGDSAGAEAIFKLTLDTSVLPDGVALGVGEVEFAARADGQSLLCPGSPSPGFATVLGPVCCAPPAPEGLSPGYWKNHPADWPTPYAASTTLAQAGFSNGLFGSKLLREALGFGGGPGVAGAQKILYRAAVAALLNAAADWIDYPMTTAQVLALVNEAVAVGDRSGMLALAAKLDAQNNLGLRD